MDSPLINVAISYALQCAITRESIDEEAIKQLFSGFIQKELDFTECAMELIKLTGSAESVNEIQAILNEGPNLQNNNSAYHHGMMLNQQHKQRFRFWTKDEDRRLLHAIHIYGIGQWKLICEFVGGCRTRSQCTQRWYRSLDPRISKDGWSNEDDTTLMELVQKFGEHSWSKISAIIRKRTDVQCRYRFAHLKNAKKEPKLQQQKSNQSQILRKFVLNVTKMNNDIKKSEFVDNDESFYASIIDDLANNQMSSEIFDDWSF
ncbi:Myb-like DNA-binding domain containing protein [Tritrichomonas foetus]|uniref:Myb-like DNA-binding domain containing protein n=1 Tax=Tritrichomonas foetus TaxID=1144522 RepID=A0A1J4JKJ3_9EUKA|nr:Myb-like DNA-binding domain containing protein [Tritrichomonas foetus]|eukprot:OHS98919.1 Myb-like DNA-binding domain containing protein [Tritrichomonas foetus]